MSEHEDMMALRSEQTAETSEATQIETSSGADNEEPSVTDIDAAASADAVVEASAGIDVAAPAAPNTRKRKRGPPPKISLHSDIESQLIYLDLLEHESDDAFRKLLHSTIDDMGAHTPSEQQMAFRRAHQIFKDLRADRLAVTLIEREMQKAAVAVFKRLIDPEGRGGPEIDTRARELAQENRLVGGGYDDVELSCAGLGECSVETEAAVRALPYLSHLDKMRSANQREKIGTLKELELWRRITGRSNKWQPKSKSPRTGATQRKAQGRARNKARHGRK